MASVGRSEAIGAMAIRSASASATVRPQTFSSSGSGSRPTSEATERKVGADVANVGDALEGMSISQPGQKSSAASSSSEASQTRTTKLPAPILQGKLKVNILQARQLRVANADSQAYVICTFESNEYISSGPAPVPASSMLSAIGRTSQGIVIPSRSRQSSSTSLSAMAATKSMEAAQNPTWRHEAVFDVSAEDSNLDVSVYDKRNGELFLGHVSITPQYISGKVVEEWYSLEGRTEQEGREVSGQIKVRIAYEKSEKKHFRPEDFEVLRLIGKGTFGQVFQVRKRDSGRIYAMKVLSKKMIVQKKEVAHTIGERNILVQTATTESPFIVNLKFSFQTPTDLFFVTDYMSGGELFWHLQREGKFPEKRAKFYIAELILALEHLHNNDIVYRDLKPENILLDATGHIALCDFGLSKIFTDSNTTNTFCGTTEYLAPEVVLDDSGYTKLVDFWSLGVLVFEMCCGWSPFYAEDTQTMYKNIAFGKVRFPRESLSTEGRSFVKGLLNRNPSHRLGAKNDAQELKDHPFFADIDWDLLRQKKIPPPFKPSLTSDTDVSNFDPEFTNAPTEQRETHISGATPLSTTIQDNFRGFTYVDESAMNERFGDVVEEDEEDEEDELDDDAHSDINVFEYE